MSVAPVLSPRERSSLADQVARARLAERAPRGPRVAVAAVASQLPPVPPAVPRHLPAPIAGRRRERPFVVTASIAELAAKRRLPKIELAELEPDELEIAERLLAACDGCGVASDVSIVSHVAVVAKTVAAIRRR